MQSWFHKNVMSKRKSHVAESCNFIVDLNDVFRYFEILFLQFYKTQKCVGDLAFFIELTL